jgi:hypothetical protein
VVQTLAAHYTAIDGARKITGMESAIAKPIGAIALSCAAVCHLFILCFNYSSLENH